MDFSLFNFVNQVSTWIYLLLITVIAIWLVQQVIFQILYPRLSAAGGVLITGTSSGIGEDIVKRLSSLGFRCYAGVRQERDFQRWKGCQNVVPIWLDVCSAQQIQKAAEIVREDLRLNDMDLVGVVNNAGIGVFLPLECLSVDEVRRQLEVNTIAPFAVTNSFLPLLRKGKQNRGRIVHISSYLGRSTLLMGGAYTMSKHALEAMADVQRMELACNSSIKVSIVEPGRIQTRFRHEDIALAKKNLQKAPAELRELYRPQIERLKSMLVDAEGIPPSAVSQVVVHAMTSRFPRIRYTVGIEGLLLKIMMCIPDSINDKVQRWGMPLLFQRTHDLFNFDDDADNKSASPY